MGWHELTFGSPSTFIDILVLPFDRERRVLNAIYSNARLFYICVCVSQNMFFFESVAVCVCFTFHHDKYKYKYKTNKNLVRFKQFSFLLKFSDIPE